MPSSNGQQLGFMEDLEPPKSLAIEQQAIGSVMIAPDRYDDVSYEVRLRPEHFYDEANGDIWRVICEIRENSKPLDAQLLIQKLKDAGKFKQVGGAKYLGQIIACVANGSHAVYYARIVKDKAARRLLIEASTQSLQSGYHDNETPINELVESAEVRLHAIADENHTSQLESSVDVIRNAFDVIEARADGKNTGLRTGLMDLDEKLGNMRPGNVTILAARPSMGKTALGMQIAMYVSDHRPSDHSDRKASVIFFSLEMSKQELAERMLSTRSGVPNKRLRDGTLTQADRKDLIQTSAEFHHMNLHIEDNSSITASQIAAVARRHKRKTKHLDLVVIDYIQLIIPDNTREPRHEQVSRISRRIKMLSREMDIPVLALAQLNREDVGKPPKISNLRESGSLEQDASQVIMIHRPAYYNDDLRPKEENGRYRPDWAEEAELYIEKNRNGEQGKVIVDWYACRTSFEDSGPSPLDNPFNDALKDGDF